MQILLALILIKIYKYQSQSGTDKGKTRKMVIAAYKVESTAVKLCQQAIPQKFYQLSGLADRDSLLRDKNFDALLLLDSKGNKFVNLVDFVLSLEKAGENLPPAAASLFWQAGFDTPLGSMGLLGTAIAQATTLGDGLGMLQRYFYLTQDVSDICLVVNNDVAKLSYRILDHAVWPRRRNSEFMLGLLAGFIYRYIGTREMPKCNIYFEHKKGKENLANVDAPHYEMHYGHDVNAIVFPAQLLDLSFPSTTRRNSNYTEVIKNINKEASFYNHQKPMSIRVAHKLLQGINKKNINQKDIASALGTTSRTMHRKLLTENKSFKSILEDCRKNQALFEIAVRKEKSLAEIAVALGYSEHSTFTRAFQKWFGRSPRKFLTMQ